MNFYSNLLRRVFRINLADTTDRNAYYLVVELFWAAILGSAATFNAAFAIRLGAENFVVGLLTSVPALVAILVSIPSGRFLERREKRTPWVFGSLLIYRVGFLLAAIVPWIHIPGVSQGVLLVIILVVLTAPAYFFNVGWIPLLAEIIPEDRRLSVFTGRNIVNGITVSIFGFLFGQWLSWAKFPGNYQIMYLLGFVCSMISMVYLFRLKVPDSVSKAPKPKPEQAPASSIKGLVKTTREALTRYPQFLAINRNTFLHGIGVWLASPLYVLYYVRVLDAPDSWLGLNGTVAAVGTIVGFSFWRWIMPRWGESQTLKWTILLVGLYPAIVGITPSLTLILFLSVINGLVVPGVNLSHFNILLKTIPAESRPSYTAIYVTLTSIGAFICPLIGVQLANIFGLGPTLLFSGLLSVVGSSSFILWPVKTTDTPPTTAEASSAELAAEQVEQN